MIEVVFGAESLEIPAGCPVKDIRDTLRHVLNIPAAAKVKVNGEVVADDHVPPDGACVEFYKQTGSKGGEWAAESEFYYLAQSQLEEFRRTHLSPQDWVEQDGQRVYREAAIHAAFGPPPRRTMSVYVANEKAIELARQRKSFLKATSREWAQKIGCSESLVRQTPLWLETMRRTGRGRKGRKSRPRVLTFTAKLESLVGKPDRELELARLIAEQEADARTDSNPLVTGNPRRSIPAHKRL